MAGSSEMRAAIREARRIIDDVQKIDGNEAARIPDSGDAIFNCGFRDADSGRIPGTPYSTEYGAGSGDAQRISSNFCVSLSPPPALSIPAAFLPTARAPAARQAARAAYGRGRG